jgi:hypothetical protein
MKLVKARASRTTLVALAVLSVVATACGPGFWFPGHGPARPSGVTVVAPGNRTQADPSGNVPLRIELSRRLDPSTLRVRLVFGWPQRTAVRDVTDHVSLADHVATGSLTATDLQPGLVTVEASARRGYGRDHHHGGREWGLATFSWEPQVALADAGRCDPLDAARCALPFPNDYFTVPDASSATGRRVHFQPGQLPTNAAGAAVDASEWNRNDGFSPGAMILAFVPGLDLGKTAAAPITDIGRSLAPDAPIVLLDADTGARAAYFAEMDSQANPAEGAVLVVRPAKNLTEGHRYVVALRGLKDASGNAIPVSRAFRLYRDQIGTFSQPFEARRAHMDRVFADLGRAGVPRHDLDLAWDFTVASEQNLAGRSLHIRDDAFASLQGGVPSFTVDSVQDDVDDRIYRRVTGTFTVPNYLTGDGSPGNGFAYANGAGPDALPVRNGNVTAGYICNIPRSVTADGNDPVTPGRGAVYGHGLLGSNSEVNAGNVRSMANEHTMVFCATKWAGFSQDDIGEAAASLQDFSHFPKVADRTQQGFLNFQFLARLIKDPRGFAANAAFQAGAAHTPVLDGTVFYDGNSQGGILGGAVTALSKEWTRAVLGVPGMNYSTLLQRSVDFDTYRVILEPSYPSELDRMILFSVVQMLWDRAEADGYAAHMTDDPYPGTPEHQVLMHVAFGDHQVANVTAEVEARTIGARILLPGLAPGRSPDVVPFWGIAPVPSLPWNGSAIVYWDSGTPVPPLANEPPRPPTYGEDPHEDPRAQASARVQKSTFLQTNGVLVDVCGGAPCVAVP